MPSTALPKIVRNVHFKQLLRLGDLTGHPELVFIDCLFSAGVNAQDARLSASVRFVGCDFVAPSHAADPEMAEIALKLENARLEADLELFDCRLVGRLYAPGLRVAGSVRVRGCRIAESIKAIPDPISVDFIGDWDPPAEFTKSFERLAALVFDNAAIEGSLEIGAAHSGTCPTKDAVEAWWHDATAIGQGHATLLAGGIAATACAIGGSLTLAGTVCAGDVTFSSATIGGDVQLGLHAASIQFRMTGDRSPCLEFRYSKLHGGILLIGARLNEISCYGAEIDGHVDLFGVVADNVNFNFATTRGFVVARVAADRKWLPRRAMIVRRNMECSGAQIRAMELRGVQIDGEFRARNATFGLLTLGMGISVTDQQGSCWPVACRISTVTLDAVTIHDRLDVSGIICSIDEQQQFSYERTRIPEHRFRLVHSTIGHDVCFFTRDLQAALTRMWNQAITWRPPPSDASMDEDAPADNKFEARIHGELDLKANTIQGELDLRNVDVGGPIYLNDTYVRLDVQMESRHDIPITTRCSHLDLEKLRCDGDVLLTGLEVDPRRWTAIKFPQERSLTGEESLRRGTLRMQGSHVKGNVLFVAPEQSRVLAKLHVVDGEEGQRSETVLDLTAITANRLALSGNNIVWEKKAPGKVSLARANINLLEIVEPTCDEIDLSSVNVDRWIIGQEDPPTANKYLDVLRRAKPFDRSTWVDIEAGLRNEAREEDANTVYHAMRVQASYERLTRWWQDTREIVLLLLLFAAVLSVLAGGWYLGIPLRPFGVMAVVVGVLIAAAYLRQSTVVNRWLWSSVCLLLDLTWRISTGYGTNMWRLFAVWCLMFGAALVVFSSEENVTGSLSFLQVVDNAYGSDDAPAVETPPNRVSLQPDRTRADFKPQWDTMDALALTLRYTVPVIPLAVHSRWEAGSLPVTHVRLPFENRQRQCVLPFTAEQFALLVQLLSWIIWPVILVHAGVKIIRGQQH